MLVSHRNKYAFIKTRKTAGTSIEIALSRYCGPHDIVTPINEAEDEELRVAEGGVPPQNFRKPIHKYTLRNWAALILKARLARTYDHMPASQVRHLIGRKTWDEYFKFAVSRNPWDATISMYHWWYPNGGPDISDFIRSELGNRIARNYDIYSIAGRVAVDKVVRFEDLGAELEEIRSQLGVPEPLRLPRAKGHTRSDRRHYRDVLSKTDADRIAQMFEREIEFMGYEF